MAILQTKIFKGCILLSNKEAYPAFRSSGIQFIYKDTDYKDNDVVTVGYRPDASKPSVWTTHTLSVSRDPSGNILFTWAESAGLDVPDKSALQVWITRGTEEVYRTRICPLQKTDGLVEDIEQYRKVITRSSSTFNFNDKIMSSAGKYSFYHTSGVEKVELNNATFIGRSAFLSCTNLKEIWLLKDTVAALENADAIPNSVESIWVPAALEAVYESTSPWTSLPDYADRIKPWPNPLLRDYVDIASYEAFTLSYVTTNDSNAAAPGQWDGSLYYSTNNVDWTELSKTEAISNIPAVATGGTYHIYLRGVGNHKLTDTCRFSIAGGDVALIGRVASLLDYTVLAAGNQPGLVANAFKGLFSANETVVYIDASFFDSVSLTEGCFESLFEGTGLTVLPDKVLTSANLPAKCYRRMFANCTGLTNAPQTSVNLRYLGNYCCEEMFAGCTSLAEVVDLTLTNDCQYVDTDGCFKGMYKGCSSITNGMLAPIKKLMDATNSVHTWSFLESTFENCTGITDISTLFNNGWVKESTGWKSFKGMFKGCTNLTNIGYIPVMSDIEPNAFEEMFMNCTSLQNIDGWDGFNTTTGKIGHSCFRSMFEGCTGLKSTPFLKATSLGNYAYERMFYGCTGIKVSEVKQSNYTKSFRIPYEGTLSTASSQDVSKDMFTGTGGEFKGSPTYEKTYFADVGEVIATPDYVEFYSEQSFTLNTASAQPTWDGTLYYAVGDDPTTSTVWTAWTVTNGSLPHIQATMVDGGLYRMYLKGVDNTKLTTWSGTSLASQNFVFTGDSTVAAFGHISKLMHTGDTAAPALSAQAFAGLFYKCVNLTEGPTLDYTNASTSMYEAMFRGCSKLKFAPVIKLTDTKPRCCTELFRDCSSLTSLRREGASSYLRSQVLDSYCYYSMFYYCKSLAVSGDNIFPNETISQLGGWCCRGMFYGCNSLPNIASMSLSSTCSIAGDYNLCSMYEKCTSLTDSCLPRLRTILNNISFGSSIYALAAMFRGCIGLTDLSGVFDVNFRVSSLPEGCCKSMFQNCTGLVNTGYKITMDGTHLPLLGTSCFESMFQGCINLTNNIGWNILNPIDGKAAKSCFKLMFADCAKVVNSTDATIDYAGVTKLAESCFQGMFQGCTAWRHRADLPVIDLEPYCYAQMYYGCDKYWMKPETHQWKTYLQCYSVPSIPCSSDVGTTTGNTATLEMFGASSSPTINRTYFFAVSDEEAAALNLPYVEFISMEPTDTQIDVYLTDNTWHCRRAWNEGHQYYSTPEIWPDWREISWAFPQSDIHIKSTKGSDGYQHVYFKGKHIDQANGGSGERPTSEDKAWLVDNTVPCRVRGNIQALLDYEATGLNPTMEYPFWEEGDLSSRTGWLYSVHSKMFLGCTTLIDASKLLLSGSTAQGFHYRYMFYACTNLKYAPECIAAYKNVDAFSQIGAAEMSYGPFVAMFKGCHALETAPRICTVEFQDEGYVSDDDEDFSYCGFNHMFENCRSLKKAPILPSTQVYTQFYYAMFRYCTSLTEAMPSLPATVLAVGNLSRAGREHPGQNYKYMFYGCPSLTKLPRLKATTLVEECYRAMFSHCDSLKNVPTLPATNLQKGCYRDMFAGSSIEEIPKLPATSFPEECYRGIFMDCTKLKFSRTKDATYKNEYRIPTTGTAGSGEEGWNWDMILRTGGSYTGDDDEHRTFPRNEIVYTANTTV